MPGVGAGRDEVGVGVDLDERRADVVDPAQGVEGDVAAVTDHHESFEPGRCAVKPASASVAADSVLDDEVVAVDVDFEPVAVRDVNTACAGPVRLGTHAKALLSCAMPAGRSNGRAGACVTVIVPQAHAPGPDVVARILL